MNNRWIPILILIALAPFFFYVYNGGIPASLMPQQQHPIATIEFQQPNMQQKMEPGAQFGIRSIAIKDGYIFNLLLDNGEWIEAHLTRATTEDAVPFVVELFKKGSYPSVILYRQANGYWITDIHLNTENDRKSLLKLLESQNLVY